MLPYGRQSITDADIAAVQEVLSGDWLTTGPYVESFEKQIGELAGVAEPAAVTGTIDVAWAHRNAVTQAGDLVDHEAASVAAPADVRYALRFLDANGSLLVEKLDIDGESASAVLAVADNSPVTMQLYALNPTGESWQRHVRQFVYTPPAGTTLPCC